MITLLLILAGCSSDDAPEQRERRSAAVAAMEVTTRDLSRQLNLSGRVEPRSMINLASRTAGAVDEVMVEEGDSVSRGDLLVRLDMAEAQAELRRAEAEQHQAQLDFNRVKSLRERNVTTETELQNAQSALQVAESVTLLWRTRVDYGEIRAPSDGVVTERYVEPGEAVQAQQVLFELAAMNHLVMRVGVTERDVVHLARGQTMPIRLDALPALDLQGEIRRVFPMSRSSNRLVTVEVSLPDDALTLGVRAGFLGRIATVIDQRPGVIAVPTFMIGLNNGRQYVFRIRDNKLERRYLETGVTRGDWTEVLDGLEPGETILASNPMEMRDGQSVRVVSDWSHHDR
ncbi:MAG: efflux RND transporter periplasmic adaptor subunit [Halomonadaceae bacterium]|nr:MAG: efflux RND transporter periplasmic adaptor subunit [Halomonadaceae bacterium]